ncbi:MAG TPA: hypothetical protein VNJ01_00070 [Bacteriovoracaceae bacterium]|nr:hypothetical protein [Bacteriovoracaceae bacterium]
MAKKVQKKSNSTRAPLSKSVSESVREPARESILASQFKEFNLSNEVIEKLKMLAANPAVRNIAAGLATAAAARLLTKMSTRYPEITTLIRENLGSFEDKLGDFTQGSKDSDKRFS